MEHIRRKLKKHHVISALALGGVVFAAINFSGSNTQPLFSSLDNFVLFASEEVKLEQDVQVSSGDVGSNKEIDIQKDAIINGNLFADKITLDKNTSINGNVSFNKLKTQKETQIFGTQTKPVKLPIANLLEIPDFQTGTQDFNFSGTSTANTLPAGSYRNIVLEKDSRLVFSGGVYNLDKLGLKENSVLIFATATVLNIKSELKVQQKVSILSGQNVKFDDLRINFQDKKPIEFGKKSFFNFKLLAPKADVHIGEKTTLRGQIIAKKIKIEKNSVLSLEQTGFKIAKPEDIITDPDGGVYPINEILLHLTSDSTFIDAVDIASRIGGRVVGVISSVNLYQIEVPTIKIAEIESVLLTLQNLNDPRILGIFRNFIVPTN